MDETDEDLARRYVGGDSSAFDALFLRYQPRLRAVFARSFSDHQTVEDLVQATFLKLHRGRERYDPSRPFRPWLYTIAMGLRQDELRRRYRLPPTAGEEALVGAEAEQGEPQVRFSMEPSLADRVRAAIDGLPESQRVVIQLHRFEQLTFEEIAAMLGASPGSVRVRASRGYGALREALAGVEAS
ncbi:MAG: RNA polymerase sigma factor [Alphaproteobacteria bacterium]|nr:RNA polymerase sigma factor [Alphaproteobacteria bacterium]MCB9699316.1 RNA polymerase sigma factor [Alphaproteobacteria bacterium]